ncbi:hypothetical protein PGB90_005176 [Kerria lacca]
MDFLYHLHQERDDLVYDCFQIFIIFDDDELNFLENIEEPPAGMQVEDSHFPPLQTPASQLPFSTPGISNLPEGKDTCLSVKKVLEVPKPDITKRRLSSLSTSSPNTSQIPANLPTVKKPKEDDSLSHNILSSNSDDELSDTGTPAPHVISLKKIFEPAEKYYVTNRAKYPLSFQNLIMFFDMCKTNKNLSDLLSSYNTSSEDIIPALQACHSHIIHKGTKNRLTRLIKKLVALTSSNN